MEEKDYKDTLNLPKTSFPMRGNLPKKEPETLKFWEEKKIYRKLLEKRKGSKKFILHDGPPYANGNIHIGHALNKILKDIIVKFKLLKGYYSPFVPGWDCHGLPIERAVFKEIGKRKDEVDPVEIRKLCRKYAEKWIEVQKQEFVRLGVFGDWENPYITMSPSYQAQIMRELGKFYEKGLVSRAKKPVYWCPNCITALAEAEIEYKETSSPSIYVAFDCVNRDFQIVIWTTTPWTLPANSAVAVHPNLEYVVFETQKGKFLVAEKLLEEFKEKTGLEGKVVERYKGQELVGIEYIRPFSEKHGKVVVADFVASDTGTGIVHIAPGHGEEDYEVGKKFNLEMLVPVDDKGRFTEEAPEFIRGESVWKANAKIIEHLKNKGVLLYSGEIVHSYPHCWRCKGKVIFRATPQWFILMDVGSKTLREIALEEIEKVKWIPEWGRIRIKNMVEQRPDWCISRQRYWGVPIVAFYCKNCGQVVYSKELVEKVAKLVEENSADVWYELPVEELVGKIKCPKCGCEEFEKEKDILDVWFDSGSSHSAVLDKREELSFPADLYLEGSDQHRGWFQASLLESCGTKGVAPYRAVLTHGFTLDEQGRKMSKSLGNVVSPMDVVKTFGADILRLWVASENFTEDVRISENILKSVADVYRKIRNTIRFMLGNLYDFDPQNCLEYDELEEIDKWAINRFRVIKGKILKDYENFRFNRIFRTVYEYCAEELSATYLDILKDTLYCELPESRKRRSAQTAIYRILKEFVVLLSPILSFTMEESYSHIPGEKKESVFLEDMPEEEEVDWNLLERWEKLLKFKKLTNEELERARESKLIGHSLEARVVLEAGGEDYEFLLNYKDFLPYLFIVSQVELKEGKDLKIKVERAKGEKCPRCWIYTESLVNGVCPRCSEVLRELEGR